MRPCSARTFFVFGRSCPQGSFVRARRRKGDAAKEFFPWEEELAGRDQSYDADEGDAENQPQQIASAETDDPREARHDRSQNLCACPSKRPAGRRSQVERGSGDAPSLSGQALPSSPGARGRRHIPNDIGIVSAATATVSAPGLSAGHVDHSTGVGFAGRFDAIRPSTWIRRSHARRRSRSRL